MSKPKKRDWMELIDEKLNELEVRIGKLEKYVRQMNEFMAEDVNTYAGLILVGVHTSLRREIGLDSFDPFIERIKARAKQLKEIETKIECLNPRFLIALIIRMAKIGEVPFQKLAPYLIGELGKKMARELIEKETMLKNYGKEGLKIWETLLKE